jgi:hypothetical protein
VNETDVKDLFASAVANPDVDRIDTDAVLRGGRRRRRARTAATVGSVLAVLVLLGSVALSGRTQPQPAAPVATSSTLTVACSPTGISVSGDAVAATSAGVVISVSSTMPTGAYLNYLWAGGGGGGDPLPTAPATWTLQAPPGQLTLSCTLNADPAPSAERTVTVTDPQRYWRAATLSDVGCGLGALPSWVMSPAAGATAEAAVDALLAQLATDGRTLTATRAPIGYPDAAEQTWIASTSDGQPDISILVASTGTGFSASPDWVCAR